MLVTSSKVIQAFWGLSKEDIKAELREALKEVLPPCYQNNDANGSGNTPENNDSGGASSPANALGETHPVAPDPLASATLDANAMNPVNPIHSDLPDCDLLLEPGAIIDMNAPCAAVG